MWLELLDAKFSHPSRPVSRLEFGQLLGQCRAATNAPCNMFTTELMAVYPDAKVVLIQRPFEALCRSFQVVIDGWFAPSLVFLARLDPGWMGSLERLGTRIMQNQFYASSKREFKADTRRVYKGHYEG
jgi:hypothetical protein